MSFVCVQNMLAAIKMEIISSTTESADEGCIGLPLSTAYILW